MKYYPVLLVFLAGTEALTLGDSKDHVTITLSAIEDERLS